MLGLHGGEARLRAGGAGRTTVTAQDLALLYAGCDVAGLHAAGRLQGATVEDLDLLAAACVSNPSAPFFF